MKKGIVGLIILAAVIAVVVGAQSFQHSAVEVRGDAATADPSVQATSLTSQVVVYYFHGNARCSSCYKIEQYAKEAIEQNFVDEMKTGKIVLKQINVEKGGNHHFVADYQLYTKSVVISLVKDGKQVRFKNLTKVWDLIGDRNKFYDYVRDEIKPFLGEL